MVTNYFDIDFELSPQAEAICQLIRDNLEFGRDPLDAPGIVKSSAVAPSLELSGSENSLTAVVDGMTMFLAGQLSDNFNLLLNNKETEFKLVDFNNYIPNEMSQDPDRVRQKLSRFFQEFSENQGLSFGLYNCETIVDYYHKRLEDQIILALSESLSRRFDSVGSGSRNMDSFKTAFEQIYNLKGFNAPDCFARALGFAFYERLRDYQEAWHRVGWVLNRLPALLPEAAKSSAKLIYVSLKGALSHVGNAMPATLKQELDRFLDMYIERQELAERLGVEVNVEPFNPKDIPVKRGDQGVKVKPSDDMEDIEDKLLKNFISDKRFGAGSIGLN